MDSSNDGDSTYTTADGQVLHGFVTGGDFVSADGNTAVVGGQMLTGTTDSDKHVFTTGDGAQYFVSDDGLVPGVQPPEGSFLAGGERRIIDGEPVYGIRGDDGSFLSRYPDSTIYVTGTDTKDPDGKVIPVGTVEHGVTTPDGFFLKGGSIRTLPDGRQLYGYARGTGFISYDEKTMVLPGGQVVTGNLDSVNIFTTSDGKTFYVGDDIQPASPRLDGSYVLPDQSTVMTSASWTVDLLQLSDSMQIVKSRMQSISDEIDAIQRLSSVIEASWSTPAGGTFTDVASQVTTGFATLKDKLSDLVVGMETGYASYVEAERVNNANVTESA